MRRNILFLLICLATLPMGASAAEGPTAKPPPAAFEKTEHRYTDGKSETTFNALWEGKDLRMIQEEVAAGDATIKREYTYREGALLHYKMDLNPLPNRKGESLSLMATFDKSGKAVALLKRIGGKPVPGSPEEAAGARERAAKLAALAMKQR